MYYIQTNVRCGYSARIMLCECPREYTYYVCMYVQLQVLYTYRSPLLLAAVLLSYDDPRDDIQLYGGRPAGRSVGRPLASGERSFGCWRVHPRSPQDANFSQNRSTRLAVLLDGSFTMRPNRSCRYLPIFKLPPIFVNLNMYYVSTYECVCTHMYLL